MPGTPARAAHGSSHIEQMVADDQRDRITRLHVKRGAQPPTDVRPERGDERPAKPEAVPIGQLATDYIYIERSTAQSRKRIDAALAMPCPTCAARPAAYCYQGGNGLCIERYQKGSRMADSTLRPGDLEKLAAVQRFVNEREQEAREAARQARGGRR